MMTVKEFMDSIKGLEAGEIIVRSLKFARANPGALKEARALMDQMNAQTHQDLELAIDFKPEDFIGFPEWNPQPPELSPSVLGDKWVPKDKDPEDWHTGHHIITTSAGGNNFRYCKRCKVEVV